MAVDQLQVLVDGHLAGLVQRGSRDRLTFAYDADYRADPSATPLSCALPLTASEHGDAKVRPYLWNLLPDNERVIERWARQFQVSARRPLDLLAAVGRDLPGAVEMLEAGEQPAAARPAVQWLTESEVAAELRRVRQDDAAWLPARGDGRWSLAGSHPKVALVFHQGRWGRPNAATPTNRILKPAIAEFSDHDVNEHLCLVAAGLCGLPAVPSTVAAFGEERALVVTRFDRYAGADGSVRRIHQEDLCQALAVMPAHKYESDGGPSAERIARLLATEVGGVEGEGAVRSFFDALVYNWLLAAPDAHAKNYALLHLARAVRLAPMYDVASALPYPDHHASKIKLAMRVAGHYRVGTIGAQTWATQARAMRLEPDEAIERARALAARVPDCMATARRQLGAMVAGEAAAFADRMVDRVAANVAACSLRLG